MIPGKQGPSIVCLLSTYYILTGFICIHMLQGLDLELNNWCFIIFNNRIREKRYIHVLLHLISYKICFCSYKEVMLKTGISNEAINYIIDNNVFHAGFFEGQSLFRFPKTSRGFEDTGIRTGLPRVVSVLTGMGSFPTGFMKQFLLRNPTRFFIFNCQNSNG